MEQVHVAAVVPENHADMVIVGDCEKTLEGGADVFALEQDQVQRFGVVLQLRQADLQFLPELGLEVDVDVQVILLGKAFSGLADVQVPHLRLEFAVGPQGDLHGFELQSE